MTFALLRAGPEDAARLAALQAETFKRGYARLHRPANLEAYCQANYTLAQAEAALADPKQVCAIAWRGSDPVGFAIVKHAPCPVALEGASAELKQIYVLPEAYGTGLADALLSDAMETIRALPAAHVWLAVARINERAQAFYRKRGFAEIGAGPTFEVGGDRVPSLLLARRA
jgi:ribosomal protein S18 acetylase RimI-like enzyme